MPQNRLAALQNQRNQDALPAAEEGRGGYEMTGIPAANGKDTSASDSLYAEMDSIRSSIQQYDANITRISSLQQSALNALDESSSQRQQAEVDGLASETKALGNSLRERLRKLATWPIQGRNVQIRNDQLGVLKSQFMEALQRYQVVEQQHRDKQKERVARQFRIVKPDARPEEIAAVVDDIGPGSNQIFAEAVSTSNRFGEARAAQSDVQRRHEDLKKIEQTLSELVQLFNDMASLVAQQEDTINEIDKAAEEVEENTKQGHNQLIRAVFHAANARKGRWICFFIFLGVAAVLAIVLAIEFHPGGPANPKKSN